jgi:type IV pilus assembly protein PilV
MKSIPLRRRQSGFSLLEALLGILIFSVGILALVALQSISVKATTESKFRADAGFLASQLVSEMWTDYTGASTGQYTINANGNNCVFSGGPSSAKTARWIAAVKQALPGSTDTSIQVITGANNLISINICWTPPGADSTRQFSTVTQINM